MSDSQAVWRAIAEALRGEDWTTAEPLLRSETERDGAPVQAPYNLAKVLAFTGRREEALAMFRRAVETDPAHAATWFELGRVAVDLERLEDGLDAFRTVCALTPEDADAWRNRLALAERLGQWKDGQACIAALRGLGLDGPALAVEDARLMAEDGAPEAAFQCYRAIAAQYPEHRPAVLKTMTRTAKGRLSLTVSGLLGG